MIQTYLYDTDDVQQLVVEYGMADSTEEKDSIEEKVGTAALNEVYPNKIPEVGFPSGSALLALLIKHHRKMGDDLILEALEDEIQAVWKSDTSVAEFEIQPVPYASPLELPSYIKYFDGRNAAVSRYFRLRLFEELGAFNDKELVHDRNSDDGLIEGLTESERVYLRNLPV